MIEVEVCGHCPTGDDLDTTLDRRVFRPPDGLDDGLSLGQHDCELLLGVEVVLTGNGEHTLERSKGHVRQAIRTGQVDPGGSWAPIVVTQSDPQRARPADLDGEACCAARPVDLKLDLALVVAGLGRRGDVEAKAPRLVRRQDQLILLPRGRDFQRERTRPPIADKQGELVSVQRKQRDLFRPPQQFQATLGDVELQEIRSGGLVKGVVAIVDQAHLESSHLAPACRSPEQQGAKVRGGQDTLKFPLGGRDSRNVRQLRRWQVGDGGGTG